MVAVQIKGKKATTYKALFIVFISIFSMSLAVMFLGCLLVELSPLGGILIISSFVLYAPYSILWILTLSLWNVNRNSFNYHNVLLGVEYDPKIAEKIAKKEAKAQKGTDKQLKNDIKILQEKVKQDNKRLAQ